MVIEKRMGSRSGMSQKTSQAVVQARPVMGDGVSLVKLHFICSSRAVSVRRMVL